MDMNQPARRNAIDENRHGLIGAPLNRVDGMYARLCRLSDPDKAGAGGDFYEVEIEHHLDLRTSEALALYVSMQITLPLSHRTPEVWTWARAHIAQTDVYPDTETSLRLWLDAVCATTQQSLNGRNRE